MAQTNLISKQRPASANAFQTKVGWLSIKAGDPIEFNDETTICALMRCPN